MTPSRRAPLTRDAVLSAAIALADAEGLDAVSMRRLAGELGVVPMALYKHVDDKDDLVTGMVDAVIEGYQVPAGSPTEPWQDAFTARVRAARAAVLQHAWLRRAIESRTVRTPAVLGYMEALTSIMLAGGLGADLVHHAMHALGNRIWGFSPELFNGPAPARTTAPQPDPGDYPGILAVSAEAQARRPGLGCDEDAEFDFALRLILDGVSSRVE
ncbi:TetR/AcrR family transcriptional regulator [Aestuariimicrobium soli]|uniref:TetR/AcrR family transcriptional regulator n=1 Tax=Aestuariimicrobium soli TaxID=2035834 RepID=UPI003EB99455